METPYPNYPTSGEGKNIKFKNLNGQEIEVKMYIKDQNLFFDTEIPENKLSKKNICQIFL